MERSQAIDELRLLLRRDQLVIVVGAGVSIGATGAAPAASWSGLLQLGIEHCEKVSWPPGSEHGEVLRKELKLGQMLYVGQRIRDALGPYEFAKWLRSTVGELKAKDQSVISAIRDLETLGAVLATTNYDSLLEDGTDLRTVSWGNIKERTAVVQRQSRGVMHLHGCWDAPDSIVFDYDGYNRHMRTEEAQATLHGWLAAKTMVFVGCGEGLHDPSFTTLLDWSRKTLGDPALRRHWRLCLSSEEDTCKRDHKDSPIVPLGYGNGHDELAGFIRRLCDEPAIGRISAYAVDPTAVPQTLPSPSIARGNSGSTRTMGRRLFAASGLCALAGVSWVLAHDPFKDVERDIVLAVEQINAARTDSSADLNGAIVSLQDLVRQNGDVPRERLQPALDLLEVLRRRQLLLSQRASLQNTLSHFLSSVKNEDADAAIDALREADSAARGDPQFQLADIRKSYPFERYRIECARLLEKRGATRRAKEELDGAQWDFCQAASLFAEAGDASSEARCLRNQAQVLQPDRNPKGDWNKAALLYARSAELSSSIGDKELQASNLYDQAWCLQVDNNPDGDYGTSAALYGQAADLHDDVTNKAQSYYQYGYCSQVDRNPMGSWELAAGCYGRAAELHRVAGNVNKSADSLCQQAWCLRERDQTGDSTLAAKIYDEAAALYRSIGKRRDEGNSIYMQGICLQENNNRDGDWTRAADLHLEAARIFQGEGDKKMEALSLRQHAASLLNGVPSNMTPQIREILERSLELSLEVGDTAGADKTRTFLDP